MTAPATWLARARRVVLAAVAGLVIYGFARFDVVQLPEGARSPLFGVHAGDRLVVDRHARDGAPGDAWLFRAPGGELLLGRAAAPPPDLPPEHAAALAAGALWLVFERPVEGLADSRVLGPVPREALAGRVWLVLPW